MNNLNTDIKIGEMRRQDMQTIRARSTNELPVYRAAANVLYVFTSIVLSSPRKLLRFCDKAIADAAEVLKCIAVANILSGDDRIYYLQVAEANTLLLKSYMRIFESLGAIDKAGSATLKKQLKSVNAQLAGWRASLSREGRTPQKV